MAVDIHGRIIDLSKTQNKISTLQNNLESKYKGIYFLIKTTTDGDSVISKHISF